MRWSSFSVLKHLSMHDCKVWNKYDLNIWIKCTLVFYYPLFMDECIINDGFLADVMMRGEAWDLITWSLLWLWWTWHYRPLGGSRAQKPGADLRTIPVFYSSLPFLTRVPGNTVARVLWLLHRKTGFYNISKWITAKCNLHEHVGGPRTQFYEGVFDVSLPCKLFVGNTCVEA